MLFRRAAIDGIADGSVTVAFRRWDRPRATVGGRQRTGSVVVEFTAVDPVDPATLTEADARSAGLGSLAELLDLLDGRSGAVYRVGLRLAGEDPRIALRAARPDAAEQAVLRARLDRFDRSSRHGPWTRAVLELIRDHPGTAAGELAERVGRERQPFKLDVRKLKELGLTESLEVGYRLSPRGGALLAGW